MMRTGFGSIFSLALVVAGCAVLLPACGGGGDGVPAPSPVLVLQPQSIAGVECG